MATKAKSSAKLRAAKATPLAKTRPSTVQAARTKKETSTVLEAATVPRTVKKQKSYRVANSTDLAPALLAEMVGTFILAASVSATRGDAFFTGVSLIVITAMMFAISGAHVNPAVSFGLWVTRQLSASRMLLYWVAQFAGAAAALLVVHAFAGTSTKLSLTSFWTMDWKVFFVEVIGVTIFMFGIAAIARRAQTDITKSVGIGLSFFVALVVATGFLSQAVNSDASKASANSDKSHISKVSNAALNPAVALTLTEQSSTVDPLTGQPVQSKDTPVSRLGVETILGPLVGAAIGANLYLLLTRGRKQNDDRRVEEDL